MLHPELMGLKKAVIKIDNKILQTGKASDASWASTTGGARGAGARAAAQAQLLRAEAAAPTSDPVFPFKG